MMKTLVKWALLAHLLVCFVLWLLIRLGVLRVKGYLTPFMVMVPLFGPACVMMIHLGSMNRRRRKTSTLEKLRMNEEIYKRMIVEGREDVPQVIPLEEALLINGPSDRRRLVMTMLNEEPAAYLPLLKKARMDEDAEVVHYAATAMAQVAKEEDDKLVGLAQRYAAMPNNKRVIREYANHLSAYLEQGLAQGQAAAIRRNQYIELLKKQMSHPPKPGEMQRLAQALLDAGSLDEARQTIDQLMRAAPQQEAPWLLLIRYYAQRKDGAGIRQTLDEMERAQIYISAAASETLAFWKGKDN